MTMHLSRLTSRLVATLALATGVFCLTPRADAQCAVVKTHSGANFGGGQFVIQAGFAEGEAAAASYTLDAGAFPIKLNLVEMIFATFQATQSTTTIWEVLIYEGTPATGNLVYSFVANDVDLPYLRCGPGTAGVNLQFSIDPNDPDQIILNDNGSHTFSVGYRIISHNNPPLLPILPPDRFTNCFPTTDADGLSQPTNNWLDSIDIGALGAPPGWHNFSQIPTTYRPTGDWNIRATYTSVNPVSISDQPDDVNTTIGQPAIFQVVGVGADLHYQWYKGNTVINNVPGRIFGATTDTLFIFPTNASDAGQYKVVVSNNCGTVTSDTANLFFPGGTMTGNVTLLDFIGSRNGRQVVLQVKPAGGTTTLATVTATLNASGNYSAVLPSSITAGTYDIFCDSTHWLRKKRANVALTASGGSGVNFTLFNGDSDNSGEVDAVDIDTVIAAFGGADDMADVDGSGEVDAVDIDLVIANFGRVDD